MEKKTVVSEEALEQVLRFRELVNEYRISLFSPEIKTREPISPKKLDQQWRLTLAKC
jgi:ATP-dependent helicase HrpA